VRLKMGTLSKTATPPSAVLPIPLCPFYFSL
jgi:hypothetical protein